MNDAILLPLCAAGLGVTCLSSLPGLFALLAQLRDRTPRDNFYEDVDGKSTPESMAAFSNKAPKICLLISSVIGFGLSIAATIFSILDPLGDDLILENWLSNGCWAAIALQAIFIKMNHSPVKSHDLGLWAFLSSLVTAAVTIAEASYVSNYASPSNNVQLIVRIVNVFVLIPVLFSCITIPRRPEVFYKGEKVDNEWTTSVLSRYTWSWVSDLLQTAQRKGDLDNKDIPRPDHTIRTENLVDVWNKANYQGGLLQSLLKAYGARVFVQWIIILIRCGIGIGPFWAMLRLVQLLEDRDAGMGTPRELWGLVFLMGLFTLGEQWLDGWVVWFSITKLFAPVRGQLSALIFEKSLRRKNVKNAEKAIESDTSGEDKDGKKGEEGDDDSVLKSKQAIANLVGVDTKHISDFAVMQLFIISSIGKLFLYSGYLVNLIGWIPFGAGILAWSFVLPANTIAARFYLKAETKLMKNRDKKLAVVNEALLGMRQIKFSALEGQWEKKINAMREIEISSLKSVFKADSILFFCWVASPILLAATSLAVYAITNGHLAPSIAFVSIGIFKSLEVSLSVLPELLTSAIDTLVSIRRIDKYLKGPEMKNNLTEGHDIAFDNATIAWPVDDEVPEEERFILNNINLSFPAGELSVISGKTGTGKSLLLSALLGECDLMDGTIFVPPTVASPFDRHDDKAHPGNWILPGAVAYVGQSPWLESASLRDNILFGLPFFKNRYDAVLEVCALKKDIEILTDGDQTELGANGINLSGGQKWRLTLARAIYSRAEILIMDDIFSAVDAHVGRHIFEKCIAGPICKGRTRLLVTHHVALVEPLTKYLVELGDGTILHCGLTSDLAEDGTLALIKSHEQSQQEIQVDDATDEATAVNSQDHFFEEVDDLDEGANTLHKVPSKTAKTFVADEVRAKGNVKAHVYGTFLSSSGGWVFWGICAVLFITFEAGNLGRNWWVRIWTGASEKTSSAAAAEHGMAYGLSYQHSSLHSATTSDNLTASGQSAHDLSYYLWVYIAIAAASGIIGTLRFIWSFIMSIKAARTLFRRILFTIMRTRLRWLDTVPVGRVLNRMTADFDIIDNRITMDMGFFFWRVLGLLGVCVAALLVSRLMIPLAVVLFIAGAFVAIKFLDGARPVKRLESNAKSPVFELFNSSLAGVSTLRAFRKTQVYVDRMHGLLDTWDTISIHNWTLNRWLGFRMALLGSIFTTVVGIIVVGSSFVDAALAGFTLSFALDFSGNMLMAIRGYATLELDMNAAERVIEYTEVETEDLGGEIPPAAWPATGNMEVKDLVVGYSDDMPPVLKGVSFDVKNNERIGVIGRTGAGKSSLTLALFRFLEARSGQVKIDGIDISKIRLHDLRSRLAIIPQDPVLFSGTIRTNLDPFEDHTDEELKDCLSRVHLVDSAPATPANGPSSSSPSSSSSAAAAAAAPATAADDISTMAPKNANIFRDLSSGISESGGNLSQGQRQLLCIARAIVSRPKVMVLDEATSAVDMATDALIQRSIREEFTDSTLIVIAHRLSTIADFDRILVLSEGAVAEFGSPRELWDREGGIFRDMCEHSGEKAKLRDIILAAGVVG